MDYKDRRDAYLKKLRDPRWQKKRLEVLRRDNFACQECTDTTATLHIHHFWYGTGEPWEVPMEALTTLCEACHDYESSERKNIESNLLKSFREAQVTASELDLFDRLFGGKRTSFDAILTMLGTPGWLELMTASTDNNYAEVYRILRDALKGEQ